jgi:hypothetical protein
MDGTIFKENAKHGILWGITLIFLFFFIYKQKNDQITKKFGDSGGCVVYPQTLRIFGPWFFGSECPSPHLEREARRKVKRR